LWEGCDGAWSDSLSSVIVLELFRSGLNDPQNWTPLLRSA
jgi:hypothetical protein